MKITTKEITQSAVFAAVLCILSVITVPMGVVPVTLGTFGIMLISVILGAKRALMSVLIFIFIGVVGLPVFSGFKGGVQVIFGPTGGYITSYIFASIIIGTACGRMKYSGIKAVIMTFLSCIAGMTVCYAIGTAQFIAVTGTDVINAIIQGALIFVPFDIIKAAAASLLGIKIRNRLKI